MTIPWLIAVDIGNSSTKIGLFSVEEVLAGPTASPPTTPSGRLPQPVATWSFATGKPPPDRLNTDVPPQPCRWEIASVHRRGTQLLQDWLAAQRPHDPWRVLVAADLPLTLRVEQPDRVGLDRLAAAVGANELRTPNRPAIVVDAGSAITVDLVAADGAFEGGAILPGFRMAAEALCRADLLPLASLVPDAEPPPPLGRYTEAAIRSGLFWGTVGAVRELIDRLSRPLPEAPELFFTGGDLRRLATLIGPQARFVPHLVLGGIAAAARSRLAPPGKAGDGLLR
jgi:type III pantothenate kinase